MTRNTRLYSLFAFLGLVSLVLVIVNVKLNSGSLKYKVANRREENKQIKTILLWNSWFEYADYRFGVSRAPFQKHCAVDTCDITLDRTRLAEADVVVFHTCNLRSKRKGEI